MENKRELKLVACVHDCPPYDFSVRWLYNYDHIIQHSSSCSSEWSFDYALREENVSDGESWFSAFFDGAVVDEESFSGIIVSPDADIVLWEEGFDSVECFACFAVAVSCEEDDIFIIEEAWFDWVGGEMMFFHEGCIEPEFVELSNDLSWYAESC